MSKRQQEKVRAQRAEVWWDERLDVADSKAQLGAAFDRLRAEINQLPEEQRPAARQQATNAINAARIQVSGQVRRNANRRKEMA